MWKIRSGPDRNLGTSWAISARVSLKGLPTLDTEKKAIFMNFFLEAYIIDIDMIIVRLSK